MSLMGKIMAAVAAVPVLGGCGRRDGVSGSAETPRVASTRTDAPKGEVMTSGNGSAGVYSFTMKTIDGKDRKLADYRGRVILIVNVASRCGFTPQYEGLEALYLKYKDRGFMIPGFPANNFMGQEPGTDAEIMTFCRTTYGVTFDMFSKISVKGKDIDPLYAWLTEKSPVPGPVSWNFNKFLVDPEGRVVSRFGSPVKPLAKEITDRIEALLPGK